MIEFLRPFALWITAIAIFFVWLADVKGWKKTCGFLNCFGQSERIPSASRKRMQALILAVGFFAFAGIALAGPHLKGEREVWEIRAILSLDGSWSMAAKDYPSPKAMRFERAKDAVGEFIKRYQYQGEMGLVIFAGKASPVVLRTKDLRAFYWVLENWIELGHAPAQGSELTAGLAMSLAVAKHSYDNKVVVVLLSDGTESSASAEVLAKYREANVKVLVVGVGMPDRVTVAMLPPTPQNRSGKEFETRLNEAPLREIASKTGGEYARLVTGRELADVFSKHPEWMHARKENTAVRDLFQIPASIALFFFVMLFLRIIRR